MDGSVAKRQSHFFSELVSLSVSPAVLNEKGRVFAEAVT
jgi:hypothetical protein